MNANEVIEAYVDDVALRLPRAQRNDVAFELRALLDEELRARAEATGREADATMAIDLVRAFGRPADVAARYRPPLTIIDPADGETFLRASVIGLAVIWSLGLFVNLRPTTASGPGVLQSLGHWWTTVVIPSLWWPGVLVVGFGVGAWIRRRWPQASNWKPRPANRIRGGRSAKVMALIGILFGFFVLLDPGWLLLGGGAAPAARDALTYTEVFRQRQAPWLLLLLALNVPIWITVIVKGHWPAAMRRVELGLSLALCAVLTWTVLDGPVFIASSSNQAVKGFLVLIVAFTLIGLGLELRRSVRPAPN